MKQLIMILLAVSVPVMFFLSVHQVYRYQQLEREIAQLKDVQIELFESNKRRIANIAILSSPKRIAELARDELQLQQREASSKVIRIVLGNKEKPDG
ncbi:MAG: septum formation initiator family protein [Spirochaetia bacterium]